jgi:ribosomal protein S1
MSQHQDNSVREELEIDDLLEIMVTEVDRDYQAVQESIANYMAEQEWTPTF